MSAKTDDGGDILWFQWRDVITIREAAIWVDLLMMLSARAADLVETAAQQLRATCDSYGKNFHQDNRLDCVPMLVIFLGLLGSTEESELTAGNRQELTSSFIASSVEYTCISLRQVSSATHHFLHCL
jgi:hypothetical protein